MKTKPWSLIVLAMFHVFAPLGNLFLNALRSNRTVGQQWLYWAEVLPKYLFFTYMLVPVMAGIFIYLCRRWSYWAYLACLAILFGANLYGYWTDMHWDTFIAMLLALGVDVIVVAYFIVPSVQSVYLNPRMRWWEANPRYNFNHEGLANGKRSLIKVLSQGGLFMTSGSSFKEGEKVEFAWNFEDVTCKVSGIVIYEADGVAGYGVRFEHTPESQKQIKQIIEKLHTQGQIVADRLPGPEDRFGVWLKKLFTRGEGLFPKINR